MGALPLQILPPASDRMRGCFFLFLLMVPVFTGCMALDLGQDANWDLRNYHWYNAYAFLNGRFGIDLLPSQIPYFYNPLLDVPFYLLATHVPARVAAFVLGAVQGLNGVLLFMIARMVLKGVDEKLKMAISAAVSLLGVMGGGGIALIGTTFGDNLTSLGVLAGILLVVRHHKKLLEGPWMHASMLVFGIGLLPGLMMGLKLPGVIYCIGICFAFLFATGSVVRRLALSFMCGLGVLVGVVLALGHWAWVLETQFGSPLFPYFNDTFKSPMLGAINLRDTKFLPHDFMEALRFPFVIAENPFRVGEIPWRDWRIPVLYLLLPLSMLVSFVFRRPAPEPLTEAGPTRYLLWMGALSYLAWLRMFSIYRYAVPIEMLTPLLIICALSLWPMTNRIRLGGAVILFMVIALSVQPGNWTRRLTWTDHFMETVIPPLGDTSDLMVLMAGIEPYAHLIPQFPQGITFIRIQSNFSSPEEDNGTNRLIRERIAQHKGRFLMLVPVWNEKDASEAMHFFHLHFAPQPCQKVQDRLYDMTPIELCPVARE